MTNDQAQARAVKLWGYRGTTIVPSQIEYPPPVYEVGRSYAKGDLIHFVCYGHGSSWEKAFAMADKKLRRGHRGKHQCAGGGLKW